MSAVAEQPLAWSLFEGKIKAVQIPDERALDIDTELDMAFAEFILSRRSGNRQGLA